MNKMKKGTTKINTRNEMKMNLLLENLFSSETLDS